LKVLQIKSVLSVQAPMLFNFLHLYCLENIKVLLASMKTLNSGSRINHLCHTEQFTKSQAASGMPKQTV
jgi:hypothetical protein